VVALGVGAAGAAPTLVSTTETKVAFGGLDPDTLYDLQVKKSGTTSWTTLSARTKRITVEFTWTPLNPVPDRAVDFTCTTSDVTCEWDKNLDGVPEATGLTWQTSYRGTGVKKPSARGVGSSGAKSAWLTKELTVVAEEPPPPAGEVRYKKTGEGAANVYGTNSLEEACYPDLPPWNGIVEYCRWGKVTQYDPPQCGPHKDSSDPFAGVYSIRYDVATEQTVTRCEIDKHRRVGAYTHDWYHSAFKLEPDWGERNDGGAVINQLNYQSIHGSPFFVHADDRNDSAYLSVSAGPCTSSGCKYYSGQPIGFGYAPRPAGMPGPLYFIPAGGLTRGVWHEVLIHVYWTPLTDGVVEGWYRPKGGTWVKRVDVGPVGSGHATQFNFPTLQTGVQSTPSGCTTVTVENINDDCHWPNVDKMGQYLNTAYTSGNGTNTLWGEFCRASSREAAETCLG
jgi:hypothetical protein